MTVRLHRGDLPEGYQPGPAIAVDTETLGLKPRRDRLCVVQISTGDGTADVVQILKDGPRPAKLMAVLADRAVLKIFHFARFDVAALTHAFGIVPGPIYCTKIASKLSRTYTDRHGLKDLVRELLGIEISKQQQSSDWGADALSQAQVDYAGSDVLHLHALKTRLDAMLAREGRSGLARACFDFLPVRAELDLAGFEDTDVFAHS
jgi:ribonuclease D